MIPFDFVLFFAYTYVFSGLVLLGSIAALAVSKLLSIETEVPNEMAKFSLIILATSVFMFVVSGGA